MHDVTLRIALVIWIAMELDVDQMDVETAFLEGVLDEDEYMYMKCPPGMDLDDSKCLEKRDVWFSTISKAILEEDFKFFNINWVQTKHSRSVFICQTN